MGASRLEIKHSLTTISFLYGELDTEFLESNVYYTIDSAARPRCGPSRGLVPTTCSLPQTSQSIVKTSLTKIEFFSYRNMAISGAYKSLPPYTCDELDVILSKKKRDC